LVVVASLVSLGALTRVEERIVERLKNYWIQGYLENFIWKDGPNARARKQEAFL